MENQFKHARTAVIKNFHDIENIFWNSICGNDFSE